MHPAPGLTGWLTSNNLMREEDNSFAIAVGPSARPGNWLATAGTGPLVLALSLYDTPASASTGVESLALPDQREACYNG